MFLYPFAIVLILLSVCLPLFDRDPVVYDLAIAFTAISASLDMVGSFPAVISQSSVGKTLITIQSQVLPFASIAMDWIIPALVGTALGLGYHSLRPVFHQKQALITDSTKNNNE